MVKLDCVFMNKVRNSAQRYINFFTRARGRSILGTEKCRKICIFHFFVVTLQPENLTIMLKTHFTTLLLLLGAFWEWSYGANTVTDAILTQLDEVVANRTKYIHAKEEELDRLKSLYRIASPVHQGKISMQIAEQYDGFNTDSTLYYATLAEHIADEVADSLLRQQARIYIGRCYAINGRYEEARQMLLPIESELTDSNRVLYYKTCSSMYVWAAEFTTIQAEKEADWAHIPALRDSVLRYETDPVWIAHERALQFAYDYPRGAISLLQPVLDSLPAGDNYIRYLANTMGSSYAALQMPDSAIYYFALSAICDMQHGVMEHASLREVALLLYRSGKTEDIERAYGYMNCCIEDAAYSKARLRTIEMAGDMPLILNAYRQAISSQQAQQKRLIIILQIATVLMGLLITMVTIVYVRRSRLNKELSAVNEQLQQVNARMQAVNEQLSAANTSLQDSNRIRDTYVTRYMAECSAIIETMTQYHKQLLRTALSDQPKALFQMVKSNEVIDKTLHDFYQRFDESFLSLFPNFVPELNNLLREDERFTLSSPQRLTSELRILALIRLGITDSEDIAHFLRLSVKTVFNYRSTSRNRALNERHNLEEQIRQIGM